MKKQIRFTKTSKNKNNTTFRPGLIEYETSMIKIVITDILKKDCFISYSSIGLQKNDLNTDETSMTIITLLSQKEM